jgi:hypothetical protein
MRQNVTAANHTGPVQHLDPRRGVLFTCGFVIFVWFYALQAKVPYLTAPGFAVALLAKFCTHKLGFDIHKFW